MSQSPSGIRTVAPPAKSNIYTVLALAALLSLIVGVAVVWMKSAELFGTSNPFEIVKPLQS